MNMMDAADRYRRDPEFAVVVDMMVNHAMQLNMSPGEMREAAIFAELKVQSLRPLADLFPGRAAEIDREMRREADAR